MLGAFLKKIEPTVSVINWEQATLADFEEFTQSFEADSDSFDAETAAAGCNRCATAFYAREDVTAFVSG